MDEKVKILIEEREGGISHEVSGNPLFIVAALVACATKILYEAKNGDITAEQLKEVLKSDVECAVDILFEHGELKKG